MKVTQQEVVDCQTVLHIELEDQDLETYLDQGFKRVAPRTVIPGFRKGKAPRRIVEQFLGRESLLNEVLESMLPEVTEQAITGQELDASGMPQIELQNLAPLTLQATVPLAPEVHLGPYENIRIPDEPVDVTDEDIQKRLEELLQSQTSWEPVERPVRMGDMVTMKASGKVEGRTILDENDSVFFLDENNTRPFAGFSQHLVGLEKDEPYEFNLTVPEDFADGAIAGKDAEFSVTLSEIKERILPELDDEFAKGFGDGHESVAALREQVEEDLKSEFERETNLRYRDSVVNALLEGTTIELPPVLVEHEMDHMERDQARLLSRLNVRADDFLQSIGKTEEEMREEMRSKTVADLSRTFALSKVAELEGLEVADAEVEERVESVFSGSPEQSQRPPNTDELKSSVRKMLLRDKSVDWLIAVAKGESPAPTEPEQALGEEAPEHPEQEDPHEGQETDDIQA